MNRLNRFEGGIRKANASFSHSAYIRECFRRLGGCCILLFNPREVTTCAELFLRNVEMSLDLTVNGYTDAENLLICSA